MPEGVCEVVDFVLAHIVILVLDLLAGPLIPQHGFDGHFGTLKISDAPIVTELLARVLGGDRDLTRIERVRIRPGTQRNRVGDPDRTPGERSKSRPACNPGSHGHPAAE